MHAEEITKAAAFAQERAEREARLNRPLFVMPTKGVWTSGFGYRWGVLHGGIDIANSIGTPIVAVADGVVIDAGPTAGYGAWVKLRHADGTVTLYGHVNTWLVSVGQRVMAGDQIATIGNRGNSTGPHCHFEVLLNGTDRIDPVPWLAQRGLGPRQVRWLSGADGPSRRTRLPIPRSPTSDASSGDILADAGVRTRRPASSGGTRPASSPRSRTPSAPRRRRDADQLHPAGQTGRGGRVPHARGQPDGGHRHGDREHPVRLGHRGHRHRPDHRLVAGPIGCSAWPSASSPRCRPRPSSPG